MYNSINYIQNKNEQKRENSNHSVYLDFYPYYSKPKIIPILKKASGVLAILSLFFFVFANLSGYLFVNSETLKKNYFSFLISLFVWIYFFVMLLIAYQGFKNPKNKVRKYYLSFWYPIINSIYTGLWLWNVITIWKKIIEQNIEHSFFLVWKILIIIHIVFLVMISVCFFVCFLSNPRIDPERILKFQKELINYQKAKAEGQDYQINMKDLN